MTNPIFHVEHLSRDLSQARTFYGEIFDWEYREIPREDNPYTLIETGDGPGANFVESPLAEANPFWLPYVAVDDLDHTLEAVRQNGGTVTRDRADEPGAGSFAIIKDPQGAALGLWQAPTGN